MIKKKRALRTSQITHSFLWRCSLKRKIQKCYLIFFPSSYSASFFLVNDIENHRKQIHLPRALIQGLNDYNIVERYLKRHKVNDFNSNSSFSCLRSFPNDRGMKKEKKIQFFSPSPPSWWSLTVSRKKKSLENCRARDNHCRCG